MKGSGIRRSDQMSCSGLEDDSEGFKDGDGEADEGDGKSSQSELWVDSDGEGEGEW